METVPSWEQATISVVDSDAECSLKKTSTGSVSVMGSACLTDMEPGKPQKPPNTLRVPAPEGSRMGVRWRRASPSSLAASRIATLATEPRGRAGDGASVASQG